MLKQSIIYLLLSIVVILLAKYVHLLIVYIDLFYTYINLKLAPIFSASKLSTIIREVITLVFIPLFIVAVPALIYRAIKKHQMHYFVEIAWFLWLVIVLSKVLIH